MTNVSASKKRVNLCFKLSEVELYIYCITNNALTSNSAGPRSAVGNVSGYRCVSDCLSRGREFDPGPVPYFRGD